LINEVGGTLSTVTGFLAGLGFSVSQELIKVGIGPLSELIAKIGQPNYLTTIFDFQNKIKIKS
jgi:hypothetical protein